MDNWINKKDAYTSYIADLFDTDKSQPNTVAPL
jgi:hypothetical protein